MVDFYSVGKAFIALLALQLIDSGEVGLDEPVASVDRIFVAAGKKRRRFAKRCVTAPRLPHPRADDQQRPVELGQDGRRVGGDRTVVGTGARHAYHTNTYGHLIGEIVHRASGETCSSRLRDLASTLGADLWFGVPKSEQYRCAEVVWGGSGSSQDIRFR